MKIGGGLHIHSHKHMHLHIHIISLSYHVGLIFITFCNFSDPERLGAGRHFDREALRRYGLFLTTLYER